MKKQARLETNITIRLQRNPKAQTMPPQNYVFGCAEPVQGAVSPARHPGVRRDEVN
jgi:hypothetical protein